jgi:lysophospholipase
LAIFESVTQTLNDSKRMENWQAAIPEFSFEECVSVGTELSDYLACYNLSESVFSAEVDYFAGYMQQGEQHIFHQYFAQKQPSEVVLIAHGYTDHAGLFHKVINYLVASGRSVAVFDQPGHGLSSGERATIENFGPYINLLSETANIYASHLKQPFHVLAQSMGGAITMDWLLREPKAADLLKSVVLFAPLVRPAAWRQAVWSIRFLSLLVDSIPRTYSRNSEDEAFTQFVRYEDPVQHDRLPAQWVRAMVGWTKQFEKKQGSDFPFYLIQGDIDETVDWQHNLEHIKKKFPNTQIAMVEGAGHHLAGESARLQKIIFEDLEQAFAGKDFLELTEG